MKLVGLLPIKEQKIHSNCENWNASILHLTLRKFVYISAIPPPRLSSSLYAGVIVVYMYVYNHLCINTSFCC